MSKPDFWTSIAVALSLVEAKATKAVEREAQLKRFAGALESVDDPCPVHDHGYTLHACLCHKTIEGSLRYARRKFG